jgi:hypothetical protein
VYTWSRGEVASKAVRAARMCTRDVERITVLARRFASILWRGALVLRDIVADA